MSSAHFSNNQNVSECKCISEMWMWNVYAMLYFFVAFVYGCYFIIAIYFEFGISIRLHAVPVSVCIVCVRELCVCAFAI